MPSVAEALAGFIRLGREKGKVSASKGRPTGEKEKKGKRKKFLHLTNRGMAAAAMVVAEPSPSNSTVIPCALPVRWIAVILPWYCERHPPGSKPQRGKKWGEMGSDQDAYKGYPIWNSNPDLELQPRAGEIVPF